MSKNKIILEADTELEDKGCREMLEKIWTKIETINDRTKAHTIEIMQIKKALNLK